MTISSVEYRGLLARTLDRRNQVCSPGRTFLCGPGDRPISDKEWGAHIRYRANASPSEQSRHENSSAELPRLSHIENERVYSFQTYIGIFCWLGIDTFRVKSVARRFLRMTQQIFSLVLVFLAAQGESFCFFFFLYFFRVFFVSVFSCLASEALRDRSIDSYWLCSCRLMFMLICLLILNIYTYIDILI